jgi:divalent metal cation (Fe/Co/Zn/Cd) transporter
VPGHRAGRGGAVTGPVVVVGSAEGDRLNQRARLLAWATVGYNAIEGVVAVAAGVVASSSALVSFGLDSAIEVSSALAVAWQFAHHSPVERERRTLRLIALSFFALAAWVSLDAARSLLGAGEAEPSTVGIALTAVSLVVMPVLTLLKRRTGRALESATVVADSTQTLLCTYLSAVVLAGLVLNATLGWSWADPVAALVVAGIAAREGLEAWRGDGCCALPAGAPAVGGDQGCGCGLDCGEGCRG